MLITDKYVYILIKKEEDESGNHGTDIKKIKETNTDKISKLSAIICPRLLFSSLFDKFEQKYAYLSEKNLWNQYKVLIKE